MLFVDTFCGSCLAAKAWLSRKGVAYRVVDVQRDDDLREALRALGWTRLPLLVTPAGAASGFDPERYAALLEKQPMS